MASASTCQRRGPGDELEMATETGPFAIETAGRKLWVGEAGGGRGVGVEPSPRKSACLAVQQRSPRTIAVQLGGRSRFEPPFRRYGSHSAAANRDTLDAGFAAPTRTGSRRVTRTEAQRTPSTRQPCVTPNSGFGRRRSRSPPHPPATSDTLMRRAWLLLPSRIFLSPTSSSQFDRSSHRRQSQDLSSLSLAASTNPGASATRAYCSDGSIFEDLDTHRPLTQIGKGDITADAAAA
jgi:hypothetical protein